MRREHPFFKTVARVPPVFNPNDLQERVERIAHIAELNRDYHAEMTARWKAGEFDQLYGKYRREGRLMKPPPPLYQE